MQPMRIDDSVPADYPDRVICILGLGFVGLTLATVMAEVGFHVIGVEIRDDLLEQLLSGDPYFFEPGLSPRLKKVIASGRLKVCKKMPNNCPATVYIITVGTPIGEDNQINLNGIRNVCADIAENLKDGDMILLRSTVKLGATRSIVYPLLAQSGKHFQLAFCPERTIEGQAMTELRFLPQVIGADDLDTRIRAAQLFQFLTPTTIRVSSFETAEMIKLVDNTRRDVMFAFSNEVARMCNAAGLNIDEVITSGRFGYSRTDLPMPGPVGGPCLSKDPHILVQSMVDLYEIVPAITIAARKVNEEQPQEVVGFLKEFTSKIPGFPKRPIISLLGIAFKGKPATDDIRGTTAKPIFHALTLAFPEGEFYGYDPIVQKAVIEEFGLKPKSSLEDAIKGANLVLILNNHFEFCSMQIEDIALKLARPGVIYDFWNCFSKASMGLPKGVQYIALGSHRRPIQGSIVEASSELCELIYT